MLEWVRSALFSDFFHLILFFHQHLSEDIHFCQAKDLTDGLQTPVLSFFCFCATFLSWTRSLGSVTNPTGSEAKSRSEYIYFSLGP